MRIHIEIPPSLLSPYAPTPGEEDAPIFARVGGHIVLLELQGTLQAEGDKDGQLIGRLGMEGDRPTLRIAHHLLHGSIVNLPKPLAVLRKAPSKIDDDLELDNGSSSDSDQDDDALPAQSSPMPGPPSKSKMRDYSSDLDPTSSSPVKPSQSGPYSSQPTPLKRKRPLLEKMRAGQAAKKKGPTNDEVARTTKYDVVGVVKMKVVFSKRPQPVVNLDAPHPSS